MQYDTRAAIQAGSSSGRTSFRSVASCCPESQYICSISINRAEQVTLKSFVHAASRTSEWRDNKCRLTLHDCVPHSITKSFSRLLLCTLFSNSSARSLSKTGVFNTPFETLLHSSRGRSIRWEFILRHGGRLQVTIDLEEKESFLNEDFFQRISGLCASRNCQMKASREAWSRNSEIGRH